MKQLVYRFLNTPIFLVLAIILIALQTSLFVSYPLNYLQPDIILLLVIWFALKRGFIEGGLLTLTLAHLTELHTSAPAGLFYSGYVAVFLTLRLLNKMIVVQKRNHLIFLTLFASIFWKLLGLIILNMLGKGTNQWRHTFALLLPGAVIEGITGFWIFPLLEKIDWKTFKDSRARDSTSEDLLLIDEEDI